jgi:hypothetical protein
LLLDAVTTGAGATLLAAIGVLCPAAVLRFGTGADAAPA